MEKKLKTPLKKVNVNAIESVLISQYEYYDIGIVTGRLIDSHWVRKEAKDTVLKWGNFQSYAEFVNSKKPWLTDESTVSLIFNQIEEDIISYLNS